MSASRRTAALRAPRVAAVQLSFVATDVHEWLRRVVFYLDAAADAGAALVVLPEFSVLPACAAMGLQHPSQTIEASMVVWGQVHDALAQTAMRRGLWVVAGSILHVDDDGYVRNHATVLTPDGALYLQTKVHPTPWERETWNVVGADQGLLLLPTPWGPTAVAVCYDVEFPELVRQARAGGARVLCVPYNTDTPQGHLRVRQCAVARCIENRIFAVLAGATHSLDGVPGTDTHFARSAILSPLDYGFPPDGVLAQALDGDESLVVADLPIHLLDTPGTVDPFADRRPDIYPTS